MGLMPTGRTLVFRSALRREDFPLLTRPNRATSRLLSSRRDASESMRVPELYQPMTSDEFLDQSQESYIVTGLLQLLEPRFEINAQLLAEITFHASSQGAKLMDHSIEFVNGILRHGPTSAHIAGLEFLDRDVDKSKVNCDRSCDRNLRRLRLQVLPIKSPQQLSPQTPNMIFYYPRLRGRDVNNVARETETAMPPNGEPVRCRTAVCRCTCK